MKSALIVVGCLALAAIALLFAIPTLIVGFEGGFRWRDVTSEASPDGRLELIVTKKMAFPANEWFDPSVVVRAELCDAASHRVLVSERRLLVEDSEFKTPAVQWNSNEVHVSGFDKRKDQTVTLMHRPNKSHGANRR